MIGILFTAVLTLVPGQTSGAAFMALFEPLTFRYTGGAYVDEEFHYRLYDPREDDSTEKQYPLFVWLHGLGEAGEDKNSHLRWMGQLLMPPPWERKQHPFFVLAIQCPRDNDSWFRGDGTADDDMVSVSIPIIEETLEQYPIDRARVYVAGVSSGGKGCWIFASRRPDLFAAAAPLSGGWFEPTPARIAALKQVPIWTFNCTQDGASQIDMVRTTVQAVAKAGGRVHLTEIELASHDSWTEAFNYYDLRNWLLAQRRGSATAPAPGTVSSRKLAMLNAARNILRHRFFDLFRGWSLPQFAMVSFLAVVVVVVGRGARKKYRAARGRALLPEA